MKTNHKAVLALGILIHSGSWLLSAAPAGYVVTWGKNLEPKDFPNDWCATGVVSVAGQVLTNAVAVAADGSCGLALRSEGTVVGWGANGRGDLLGYEVPATGAVSGPVKLRGVLLDGVSAISTSRDPSAESFNLALRRDGSIAVWGGGDNHFGQTNIPNGLTNVIATSAGETHGLALRADGTVASWGDCQATPTGLSNVVAISAGRVRNLALLKDGTVRDWPVISADPAPTVPAGLSNVVAISAGDGHCLALRRDGTVVGWGANEYGGATGVPTPGMPNESSGTVRIDGRLLSNVVAIAAGEGYSLALKRDGTVISWGRPYEMELSVPVGLTGVVAIAAGHQFCLAITTNVPPPIFKR